MAAIFFRGHPYIWRTTVRHDIGRCISAVHIRRCSAGVRQQCLVAEWLGLSVTVRVRVRARARGWNPFLLFFFSSL